MSVLLWAIRKTLGPAAAAQVALNRARVAGDPQKAEGWLRKSLELCREYPTGLKIIELHARHQLAEVLWKQGHLPEAEQAFSTCLNELESTCPTHPFLATFMLVAALFQAEAKHSKPDALAIMRNAEGLLNKSLADPLLSGVDQYRRTLGLQSVSTYLGELLFENGAFADAEMRYRKALEIGVNMLESLPSHEAPLPDDLNDEYEKLKRALEAQQKTEALAALEKYRETYTATYQRLHG